MAGQRLSFRLPQLGASSGEGIVGRWLKQEGEAITEGEPLVEVVTDKVNSELPAPATGTLRQIIAPVNAVVPTGAELAILEVGAEAAAPAEQPSRPARRRVRTSPAVRRLAREQGVDVDSIAGSGPGGRVTRADVARAAARAKEPAATELATTPPASPAPPVSPEPAAAEDDDYTLVPLTPMRRAIAAHLTESVQTMPQAWTVVEVDVTPLVHWRQAVREEFRQRTGGVDLGYLVFAIKATVEALREWAILNARWTDQGVLIAKHIHLGVAVAVPDGLIVPVLRDADARSIAGLARELDNLIARARGGELTPADVQGATFTINNTGVLGSVVSRSIVPVGQAGILSTEAIVKRPVVVGDDAIAIRSMMNVCLAYDHRVLDGAAACGFMQTVKQRLESFGPDTPLY